MFPPPELNIVERSVEQPSGEPKMRRPCQHELTLRMRGLPCHWAQIQALRCSADGTCHAGEGGSRPPPRHDTSSATAKALPSRPAASAHSTPHCRLHSDPDLLSAPSVASSSAEGAAWAPRSSQSAGYTSLRWARRRCAQPHCGDLALFMGNTAGIPRHPAVGSLRMDHIGADTLIACAQGEGRRQWAPGGRDPGLQQRSARSQAILAGDGAQQPGAHPAAAAAGAAAGGSEAQVRQEEGLLASPKVRAPTTPL